MSADKESTCEQCSHFIAEKKLQDDTYGRCIAPIPISHGKPNHNWDEFPTIGGRTTGCPVFKPRVTGSGQR